MSALAWILRAVFALAWGGVFILLLYTFVLPAFTRVGYVTGGLTIDAFKLQGGDKVSGSEDAVYFAARYDCRRGMVTRLIGPPPQAEYWMIGIYDNRLMRIPGGQVNNETVDVEEDGKFYVNIQALPGPGGSTLECGRNRTGLIILRVFAPVDPKAVVAPRIERVPMAQLPED